jgi:hypothetical protein
MINRILIILLIYSGQVVLFAQYSGSLQTSYQYGNLPEIKPYDRTNLYSQLNLQCNQTNLDIGLRLESFGTSSGEEYGYLSQKYIMYQNENLQVTVGNIYEILGRGILLRGYEIPGSVYEDYGSRQRYAFYKDIEGFSINYVNDYFQTKLLYGRILDNLLPPLLDKNDQNRRRPVLIEGAEINYVSFTFLQPGILLLRTDGFGNTNRYAGFNFQGYSQNGLQYYAEYSRNINPLIETGQTGSNDPYGLYSSLSYSTAFVSTTLEIKDYHKYSLGINDPPPLVREHSFSLLNRATHTIEPSGEKGYQLETLINTGDLNTLTFNHSASKINLFEQEYDYYEYYADVNYYADDDRLTKLYVDFAKDEFKQEEDRFTTGVFTQDLLTGPWSYSAEMQYQHFTRNFKLSAVPSQKVKNILFSGAINHSPGFSFSLFLEWVDDISEGNYRNGTQISGIFKDGLDVDFFGMNISYIYNQTNTFALFYGERRGGNACSGGVCYQVQPFSGFEFKLTSNF